MKNLFIKILTLVILIIQLSCQSENYVTSVVTTFPMEKELDTICSIIPSYGEHLTNSINVAGEYIIGVDYKSPFLLSVFDNNLSLSDTIIEVGHGHDEMLSAEFYGQWDGADNNPNIILYDRKSKRIVSTTVAPFTSIKTIADLSKTDSITPSKVIILKDSICIGVNLPAGEQAQLFKYDIKNGNIFIAPNLIKFNGEDVFYTSQYGIAVREDEKQIVTPYYSLPLICFYDENLDLIKKIYIGTEIDTELVSINDTLIGFVDAKYCGDKIVALLIDPTGKVLSRLLIFDNEGEPLGSFIIGKSIGFCIDISTSRILSLEYDEDKGIMSFLVYPLPDLLKP